MTTRNQIKLLDALKVRGDPASLAAYRLIKRLQAGIRRLRNNCNIYEGMIAESLSKIPAVLPDQSDKPERKPNG